jgi:hypothetical protein
VGVGGRGGPSEVQGGQEGFVPLTFAPILLLLIPCALTTPIKFCYVSVLTAVAAFL